MSNNKVKAFRTYNQETDATHTFVLNHDVLQVFGADKNMLIEYTNMDGQLKCTFSEGTPIENRVTNPMGTSNASEYYTKLLMRSLNDYKQPLRFAGLADPYTLEIKGGAFNE